MADDESGWRPLKRLPLRHQVPDGGAGSRLVDLGSSPFSRLALAHVLSAAGDGLVTLALAGSLFFDISPTAARGRVALSLLLTMAPFAVVAPLLGPIIDRTRGGRRMMVLVSAVGRALACLVMARVVKGLFLFPAAFTTLVFSKGYVVAKASLVPAVVKSTDELVEANSKLSVGGAVVGFLAAIPGVAVLKLLGAAPLLRLAALVYFAMALAAMRIVVRRPPEVEAPPADPTEGGEIPTVAWSPSITLGATAMGSLRLMVGFTTFLIAFSFRRTHTPAWWFGVVLAVSVAMGLAGAAVAPRLRDRVREEHMVVGALAGVAIMGLLLAQVGGRPAAALLAGGVAFAASGGKQAFDSLVQRDAPEAAQARAFARFEAGFQLVWVLGALIPVVFRIREQLGFTMIAIGAAVIGVVFVVSRRAGGPRQLARRVRTPRDRPPAQPLFPSPPSAGPFPVIPPPLSRPQPPPE